MTDNQKEIQEFVRKKCIESAHPEAKSYTEALQEELGFGCKIKAKIGDMPYIIYGRDNFTREYLVAIECDLGSYSYEVTNSCLPDKHYEIIGQPITLSRILNAIDPYGNYGLIAGHITKINRKNATYKFLGIKWKYLNQDGSEATFQDQTPETQKAIAKLLGWEENK